MATAEFSKFAGIFECSTFKASSDLTHIRGQGQAGEVISHLRPGVVTLRSHPEPEARGGSWEEPPTPEARACSWEEPPEEKWLSRYRRA